MTDSDFFIDPNAGASTDLNPVSEAPTRAEATRFALTDAPRGENDESAAAKAEYLGGVYFDLLQKAQRGIDPNQDDSAARAEAVYFSEAMTGQQDVYGKLWRKGGFKTGREYLAKMHDFFLNGGEKNLTQAFRDFRAKSYDEQVAEALANRKDLDALANAVGNSATAFADFFVRRGEASPLTNDERKVADKDLIAASDLLDENERYVSRAQDARRMNYDIGPGPDSEKVGEASKKIKAWREKMYNERVRAEYAAKLLADNAWYELSAILPEMSENARECAKALMESKDNRLPETMWAKFNALDDGEKQLVCRARTCLAPRVEGSFANTVGDMAIGAANIAANVIAAPLRFGNKLGMMAANKAFDAGFDVNELARRRQYLWQATGRFNAGGAEGGYLPQLQFERICEDHGLVAESLIGAVSTLPYMAAAAVPGIGVATVAMEAMNEMDDHVAMNGGDIGDPDYILSNALFGAMYAYTERLQVEKLLGGVSELKLREAMLKGFFHGMKDRQAVRTLTIGTLSESLQEGLQNGIMQVNEAFALDQDAMHAFAEGFTQDFVGSLGTMFIVGAGGLVGGHWKRSGFNNGFTEEGRLAGRERRSADLETIYEADMSKARLVDYAQDVDRIGDEFRRQEHQRLFSIWSEGGKDALVKEGIDPVRAEEWDYFFASVRNDAESETAPDSARADRAAKDVAAFIRERMKDELQQSPDEAQRSLAETLDNLDHVRSVWAQGAGIAYRTPDGRTVDAGAKALERMGFTPEHAARISRLFNYERAAAYSPAALEGIRDVYEQRMGGRVGAVAAMAQQFGGQLVHSGGNTYLRFDRADGTQLVQIVESAVAVDLDNYDEGLAVSIESETGGEVTKDAWRNMTPAERRAVWNERFAAEGSFKGNGSPVEIVLPSDPSARITSDQAAKVIGTIRVSDVSPNARTAPDSSAVFHETYHAFSYFAQASGLWTEDDAAYLAKRYGGAKKAGETHDEEAGAEGFREYLARRAAGALTAEDEKSPFAKIYSAAAGLDDRVKERAAQEKQATEAERNFFDQLVADVNAQPEAPAPAEADAEPQNANAAPGNENAAPVNANAAPVNANGPKTWTAFTPTGNVKVSGHWAVYDLPEVIHSNNPLYGVHMRAQLRDRKANKAEEDTRNDIVNNFQGERLLEAPDTANGAPIVFIAPDENGVQRPFVLSGNGRVLVLNELANRHLYDRYRNVMKKWAAENGVAVPEGETPVLVRVIDDYGGSNRDKVADLSNTNSIQQYNEEEQARADAEVVKALDLARLYQANADGSPDMTPGANDDFFNAFIRGVGDTSLYNSDRTLTQAARDRAQRALLAIAVGQGRNGRDVVKKLVEQTDTLGMTRQKNAAAIMAAPVAALEKKTPYAIGADVSRAMADYMDYAERKKAGKIGTFDEYEREQDLLDQRSAIAGEILKLFGSARSAAAMAEYVKTYCRAAEMEDPAGGLFGAARTREEIWKDAAKLVDENAAEKRYSIAKLYTGSAADYEKPSLLKIGTGEGSQVYGWGLYASGVRGVAERYSNAAMDDGREVFLKGKRIDENNPNEALAHIADYFQYHEGTKEEFTEVVKAWIKHNPNSKLYLDIEAKWDEVKGDIELGEVKKPRLYEQTFFTNRAPGDESHLLNWYEPVSEENLKRIVKAINADSSLNNEYSKTLLKKAKTAFLSNLSNRIGNKGIEEATGADIYKAISELYNTNREQSASEFLARADIDGIKYPVDSYGGKTVKDGDKAGWNYVSFRDDNISVDHKWVDGVQRFSINSSLNALSDIADGKDYGVLQNEKYGEIRYPLGRTGKGGFGFLHIVEQRMAKDGATLDEAIDTAIRVGVSAQIGTETEQRHNTHHLDWRGTRAIIGEMPDKTIVITGYEINTEESTVAKQRAVELSPRPHVRSEEVIRALKEKLASTPRSIPYSASGSQSQIDTPAFKAWFGKSKVVDADGKPLIVYHGTDADFTVFDRTKGRSTMDIQGMFFSPWELDAGGYGNKVGTYYLSIQNPAPEDVAYKALNKFKGQNEAGRKAREYLESLGYDGVVNGEEEYIAFRPEQIKSATDNIGTFDPDNPDIRYSVDKAEVNNNIDEMLSKLDEAKGKSKEEIFRQYDFHQKVIAQLPIGMALPDSVSASNPVVKCAQNYLLAHLVVNDTEHHDVKITAEDAKRIIGLIDPKNEMRLVEQRGSHSIAFIGQREDGTWDCICIAPKRGEYYVFKTMFAQKKKPYQDKTLIRFSVVPELGRTLGPDITGMNPRPDATSIRGASTTARSISQSSIESQARLAVKYYAQESAKSAEDALENYVAYFKLSHGSIPRAKTLARIGLSLGMPTVDSKRILKNADALADRAKGSLIEKAAKNGDVGTAMSLLKREKDIDRTVDNLIAGGVTLGGQLTHKGVGQVNALLQRQIDRMMADMNAANLADMEKDTGLDLAAEILANNPDAFDTEYRKAKKAADEGDAAEEDENGSVAPTEPEEGRELSDADRYKRARLLKEANEKVAKFIEEAKRRAEDNKQKAEKRRQRILETGGAGEDGGGDAADAAGDDPYNPTPTIGRANFKTPGEFASFLRVWAQHKFAQTHGLTTLGKVEQDRLFAEFYRLCARQELQDLADKLLAPADETGRPNARLAKLGAGARVWVNRRLAEMEKGIRPDSIERMSADIFAFINKAAVRVSRVDLITTFKAELKERFLKDPEFDEFKQDTERKVTGWVEEATRYICRVCDLSSKSVNGDPSQLEREYQRLHEIIDRRQQIYDESGKEVAAAAQEDAETIKAQGMLALLDKFGAMRSLMPGEILDLQNAAFQYLEEEAVKLEQAWKDTREQQEQIRRDFAAAIQGPNGQRYESKGAFAFMERLFDGLNGLIRLRLKHLTRFADPEAREKATAAINSILVRLGDGETAFARALQDDRDNLFQGLAQIFNRNGRVDNGAIKRYLERMDERIPAELARQISNQGYAESMTYGQMLQLLVSLEQRSFKNAIKANGREGQAELIRSFTYADENGNRVKAFTREDDAFIDFLRLFYAEKRDSLSEVTMRMVGHKVDSPDPLYCPVRRWIDDKARGLHTDPTSRWDPISKIFSRRVESDRDFDESRTILGLFYENSRESAKLTAWAERGSFIRNVVTSAGFQAAVKRAFGAGELGKILKQLEATFNGGEVMKDTPAELAAVDKALNFTTYAYLGFNPLSAAKQTTSFTVWANALPGGFKDLWRHMTHFDKDVVKHLKESDEYKVRYGNNVGSGQDMATKGLNANPSSNLFMSTITGAGMWLLKKGDFAPGVWIAQGVYKDLLDRHLKEGMAHDEADRLAITETFNMLEETQQSGRTYNTNMLTIEHGRIGRLLTQFATSPLQQLQYETQALREWRDMVKYNQGEKKITEARQRYYRAALINHVLLPAALNLVIAIYKAAMGEEPPWEKDGYHWTLLTEILMGQFSRVFFLGAFTQTTLNALFKRETPRAGQLLPVEGMLGMGVSAGILVHDIATMDVDRIQKDLERAIKGAAPTRIPYNIYRRFTGDADVDRKAKEEAAKRK